MGRGRDEIDDISKINKDDKDLTKAANKWEEVEDDAALGLLKGLREEVEDDS